jgi:hypothetical protein
MNYLERLKISIIGNDKINFYTKSKDRIAKGYNRIVIGERGPYIEFEQSNLFKSKFFIPRDCEWRTKGKYSHKIYYLEFRTKSDNVKIYLQVKPVNYADYKIGKYYISPFDLLSDEGLIIEKLRGE